MKTISSSTGTARKNSTTAQQGQRTHPWSESLPTPKTTPKTTAARIAVNAILRVSRTPSTRSTRTYSGVTKTSHLSPSNCPSS